MKCKLNLNAVNQLAKENEIYTEGDSVYSVALVIKGRVLIHNSGANVIVGSGSFIGINDLYMGKFQSTYTAYDDLLLYVFGVNNKEELDAILSINNDYHGFMVMSYNKIIYELNQIYDSMVKSGTSLFNFIKSSYQNYIDTAKRLGYQVKTDQRYHSIKMLGGDLEHLRDRINYYTECRTLPMDVVKAYFSYGNVITLYQVEDQVDIMNQQLEVLKELSSELLPLAECLVDESETCLFRLVAELILEIENANGNTTIMMDMLDSIIEEINNAEKLINRVTDLKLSVNRSWMEEVYHRLLTGNQGNSEEDDTLLKYTKEDSQKALTELNNSFLTILSYAEIKDEQAEKWNNSLLDYINLKDKSSGDDHARRIRKHVTEAYYELYKAVFLKAYKQKDIPRIIEMFLKYGYADERLLSKEQLLSLYYLKDTKYQGAVKVYSIYEWLTLIYEGKKEPSKNEFDLDYTEMLTEMKKQGKLTEKDVQVWLADPIKRIEYEIQNMFRYNNRVTSSLISTFVPILHNDVIPNDIEKLYVNAEKVSSAIGDLLRVDYSIFDRELLYVNKENKIEKEYIVKTIYPDIILMPTMGSNGAMWQEISGKKRDTPGRFLLPIFTDTQISSILLRLFGRFRWELCRTIEGSAWNDIKHKSLTSEYSDYIQFYRKNKELSEEKKEKIKLQIQKGRNSTREIFVIDYEQWINYESMGAIKLNKFVRELMATYCPFSKTMREQIKLQPLFEDAMLRYNKNKQKKIREIEARHRLLQKEQIELTQELIDTLEYYKES